MLSNGWEKIRLEEEAIREIMVADTDWESGAEASDVEDEEEEEEKEKEKKNNNEPQQKSNHRLQQVADYQPGDCLKEWTQIFILFLVQKKVLKKVGSTHQRRQLATVLMFFTEIFHLLVEQTNIYYQPDLAADCLTLHCRTWWLSFS